MRVQFSLRRAALCIRTADVNANCFDWYFVVTRDLYTINH